MIVTSTNQMIENTTTLFTRLCKVQMVQTSKIRTLNGTDKDTNKKEREVVFLYVFVSVYIHMRLN